MIRLSLNEQQLFDLIMALYAMGTDAQQDPETARRREILLEKLHRAFDNKTMAARGEMPTRSVHISATKPHAEARA